MSDKMIPSVRRRVLPMVLAISATLLLLTSLRLPLWHMRLEAPQYREDEALKIAVFPNRYGGDLRELSVLNQYIGVHVPATLPQFRWLPAILAGAAALGLVASLAGPKFRTGLILACSVVAVGVLTAAAQAGYQMHDIGHKRDQRTVLAGVHDFTPPFLGTSKIAQFTVSSGLGLGGWFVGAALILQAAAACMSHKNSRHSVRLRRAAQPDTAESTKVSQFAYQI